MRRCRLLGPCRSRLLVTRPMRHTGANVGKEPLGLQITCAGIVTPPFNVEGGTPVPDFKCLGVVLAHLFFRHEAVSELLEYQVRVDGCDPAYQYHKHPFHQRAHAIVRPTTRKVLQVPA